MNCMQNAVCNVSNTLTKDRSSGTDQYERVGVRWTLTIQLRPVKNFMNEDGLLQKGKTYQKSKKRPVLSILLRVYESL